MNNELIKQIGRCRSRESKRKKAFQSQEEIVVVLLQGPLKYSLKY